MVFLKSTRKWHFIQKKNTVLFSLRQSLLNPLRNHHSHFGLYVYSVALTCLKLKVRELKLKFDLRSATPLTYPHGSQLLITIPFNNPISCTCSVLLPALDYGCQNSPTTIIPAAALRLYLDSLCSK